VAATVQRPTSGWAALAAIGTFPRRGTSGHRAHSDARPNRRAPAGDRPGAIRTVARARRGGRLRGGAADREEQWFMQLLVVPRPLEWPQSNGLGGL